MHIPALGVNLESLKNCFVFFFVFLDLPMSLQIICYPKINSSCLHYIQEILFSGQYIWSPRSVIHKDNKVTQNMIGSWWRGRKISAKRCKGCGGLWMAAIRVFIGGRIHDMTWIWKELSHLKEELGGTMTNKWNVFILPPGPELH